MFNKGVKFLTLLTAYLFLLSHSMLPHHHHEEEFGVEWEHIDHADEDNDHGHPLVPHSEDLENYRQTPSYFSQHAKHCFFSDIFCPTADRISSSISFLYFTPDYNSAPERIAVGLFTPLPNGMRGSPSL